MANQSSARIKGDDYQFLFSWYHIIALKKNNTDVAMVRIEDPKAVHVDDVTVFYNNGKPPDFFQVKYHVDRRSQYTVDLLLDESNGTSLLKKFYKTYKKHLDSNPGFAAKLHLVTNWTIDPTDKILSTVSNENLHLADDIFLSSTGSDAGKLLKRMSDVLKTTADELIAFLKTMCFLVGRDCTDDFKKQVAERMQYVGLKHDENALAVAVQIVRDWIKHKHYEVDLGILETVLTERDLFEPKVGPLEATVYMVTVKKHQFDLPPDFNLDFRKFYAEEGAIKGHELLPGNDYNNTLLPRIYAMQKKVNKDSAATLIRARGFARLSPWFAFCFVFSSVSGYTIEVNQNDKLWRTDEKSSPGFKVISENGSGDSFGSDSKTVAVGISITGPIGTDVKNYISNGGAVDGLLLLRPQNELGLDCLANAGDVAALAKQVKEMTREFVKANAAERLLLFYYGPLSGACFIGHQLNAVCKEIQIMENIQGSYIPSFLLK